MLRRSLQALRRADAASIGVAVAPPWVFTAIRPFAQAAQVHDIDPELRKLRNIGISAHIDSGKTTLTERILFYTGRIHEIHEVRGRDGVGAKMDSMELEREKGITIKSAATYCQWKDSKINIIDTPGHVDFTIEVERSLRVLDGAILVLCGCGSPTHRAVHQNLALWSHFKHYVRDSSVGGVQSQSITVDRQMRRYDVPRVAFINKLDRVGADPWRVVGMVRDKLKCHCAPVQIPMGLEDVLEGVVDIVRRRAITFEGASGETIKESPVPEKYKELMEAKRHELIEKVAEVDDELAELYLGGEDIPAEKLSPAIRRACLALKFTPVFLGSAYKNKGVQLLLDGVIEYLPSPDEKRSVALDLDKAEEPLDLQPSGKAPLVALAFKLEEGRFGQLTYMRIYQGTLRKGNSITNTTNGKRVKVPRLVRMHSDDMEDVESIGPGEIGALFGVECASGDTFTDGTVNLAMTSMRVPEPVMSLAVSPKSRDAGAAFSKALNRFQKEDPTFRVAVDAESGQTIISGMGELHLEVYVERMRREYKVDCEVGKPRVNYREAITRAADFDYLHKKQSGGQGQYGRVVGRMEPLPEGSADTFEFVNGIVGSAISPGFIAAIEKGFREAVMSGGLTGHPVDGVRVTLTDGASHAVDSSELAFKIAALNAFRQAFDEAGPTVLEPIMKVEITIPVEYQGAIVGSVNRRKGMILNSEQQSDDVVLYAEVPLNNMFGYSTELRSMTQGKGEFTMEYERHSSVTQEALTELTKLYGRGGALSKLGKQV